MSSLYAVVTQRSADPASVISRAVLRRIFSTLGRLRVLTDCRRQDSGRYSHAAVGAVLGADEADRALRAAHELVWSEWVGGSLEQQHVDLAAYLCGFGENIQALFEAWHKYRSLVSFIPNAASTKERALFTNNLSILIALLRNQDCLQRPRVFPSAENELMEQMLKTLRAEYIWPRLTLGKLAARIGRSEDHLGRIFKQCTGKRFHDYLREFRMDKAVTLLSESAHSVKTVAGMIGYGDASYFIRAFQKHMACTPMEFRAKCGRLRARPLLLPLA